MTNARTLTSARKPALVGAAMAAALAMAALIGVPVSTAQAGDPTNGGRAASSLSEITVPENVRLGSIGGEPLSEVGNVDPQRYAGKWYQVAAIPQPFNLQCTANTTADYAVVDPGVLSVHNSCDTPFGARSEIFGQAVVKNPDTNASLRVGFDGVPGQDPAGPPNYRVTYLADDYSLAIVGSPERTSGFVLSRTPNLDDARWSEVRAVINDRGWTDCAFLTSPQNGGLSAMTPLCLH